MHRVILSEAKNPSLRGDRFFATRAQNDRIGKAAHGVVILSEAKNLTQHEDRFFASLRMTALVNRGLVRQNGPGLRNEGVIRTTVSKRGQTVIPAELRRRYRLGEGSQIEWIDTGSGLKVIPVPLDPIAALRGIGRGEKLGERLLEERRRDRARERVII